MLNSTFKFTLCSILLISSISFAEPSGTDGGEKKDAGSGKHAACESEQNKAKDFMKGEKFGGQFTDPSKWMLRMAQEKATLPEMAGKMMGAILCHLGIEFEEAGFKAGATGTFERTLNMGEKPLYMIASTAPANAAQIADGFEYVLTMDVDTNKSNLSLTDGNAVFTATLSGKGKSSKGCGIDNGLREAFNSGMAGKATGKHVATVCWDNREEASKKYLQVIETYANSGDASQAFQSAGSSKTDMGFAMVEPDRTWQSKQVVDKATGDSHTVVTEVAYKGGSTFSNTVVLTFNEKTLKGELCMNVSGNGGTGDSLSSGTPTTGKGSIPGNCWKNVEFDSNGLPTKLTASDMITGAELTQYRAAHADAKPPRDPSQLRNPASGSTAFMASGKINADKNSLKTDKFFEKVE